MISCSIALSFSSRSSHMNSSPKWPMSASIRCKPDAVIHARAKAGGVCACVCARVHACGVCGAHAHACVYDRCYCDGTHSLLREVRHLREIPRLHGRDRILVDVPVCARALMHAAAYVHASVRARVALDALCHRILLRLL